MAEPEDLGSDETEGLREEPVRRIDVDRGAVVIRLAGELDLYNADAVRDALFGSAAGHPQRLVVDLAAVRFMDSTVLGLLIEARTKLDNRQAFILAAPGLETRRALQVSGLDRHFSVHETVAEALAAEV